MPKVTDPYERQHIKNLARYGKMIDKIFRAATQEAAQIGVLVGTSNFDPSRVFSFKDYPITLSMIQSLLSRLADSVETAVVNGIEAEWTLANNKNNALSQRVFGDNIGRLTQEQYRRYFSTNDDARQAFIGRKEQGLNLSERVWNYAQGFKNDIELGLDLGIRNGLDADAMSRELRQFLRYPDKLFRRVRDLHGNLVLSQRAADFHPGQGVYRSSYKNARRLAVTETNMAYRTADYERMQQLDFVVGIEIRLSNNHTCNGVPLTDICDDLCGRYPKDFKFTGWHPHCRCHVVQILKTEAELMEENRAVLRGEEPSEYSVNQVKEVPIKFKQWVEENASRIGDARSIPYFVRDNTNRVARILYENATQTNAQISNFLNTAKQAMETMKKVSIEDIKKEFQIEGEQYISQSSVMQFDLLGLKKQINQIAQQYDFDIDIARINVYEDGNWNFKIASKKREIYKQLNGRKFPTFTLTRSFYDNSGNGLECSHDLFMIAERLQGKGISKDLFRTMYKSYQKMGARTISVHANINVGGYTWAKYGFNARGKMEALQAVSDKDINGIARNIIQSWYEANKVPDKTPFPMHILIDKLGSEKAKSILLSSDWRGVIDLQNEEQVKIWEHYLRIR